MIRREKMRQIGQSDALVDSWTVTFTDLMTLLVTLFVLFISMSTLRQGTEDAGTNTEWTRHGWLKEPGTRRGQVDIRRSAPQTEAHIGELGAWMEQIKVGLGRAGMTGGYAISYDGVGMALSLTGPIISDTGTLTLEAARQFGYLAAYLAESGQAVEVTAVTGRAGSDEWSAAARRAEVVAAALVASGADPDLVIPVARALSATAPLYGQDTADVTFVFAR